MPMFEGRFYTAREILCADCHELYASSGQEITAHDACPTCRDSMLSLEVSALGPEDEGGDANG
jgi:hypothetical protein